MNIRPNAWTGIIARRTLCFAKAIWHHTAQSNWRQKQNEKLNVQTKHRHTHSHTTHKNAGPKIKWFSFAHMFERNSERKFNDKIEKWQFQKDLNFSKQTTTCRAFNCVIHADFNYTWMSILCIRKSPKIFHSLFFDLIIFRYSVTIFRFFSILALSTLLFLFLFVQWQCVESHIERENLNANQFNGSFNFGI